MKYLKLFENFDEDDYFDCEDHIDKYMPDDSSDEYFEILNDEKLSYNERVDKLYQFFEENFDEDRFCDFLPKNGSLKGFCEYLASKKQIEMTLKNSKKIKDTNDKTGILD